MIVQYASDLHLEFPSNSQYLLKHPIIPVGEILLLAGDIYTLIDNRLLTDPFWDWACDNFREVLVVPGNHKYYHQYDLAQIPQPFIYEIRHNVRLCSNAVITIDDVNFILTTLWGYVSSQDAYWVERRVSDFSQIKYNGEYMRVEDFNSEHQKSLQFLSEAVNRCIDTKTVVVSHHVPTTMCMSPEFKGTALNGAFVVELHDFIHDHPIDYWIYGHSHRNRSPLDINGTKVMCNQLGYVSHHKEYSFNPRAIFKI